MDTESRQYHEYLEEFRFLHDAKLSEDYLDEPDVEGKQLVSIPFIPILPSNVVNVIGLRQIVFFKWSMASSLTNHCI